MSVSRTLLRHVPRFVSNPYEAGGTPHDLVYHFHTNDGVPAGADDGQKSCRLMVDAYRAKGFSAVIPTPHDAVPALAGIDSVIQIQGTEHTAITATVEKHVCGLFVAERIYPGAWPTCAALVPLILAGGGFPVAAHPNYTNAPITSVDIAACDIWGVEVYNQQVEGMAAGEGYADEGSAFDAVSYACDTITSHPVWCFCASDAHTTGTGMTLVPFNVVFTPVLNAAELEKSIRGGNFYATQGNRITSISVSVRNITVVVPESSNIEWIITGGVVDQTDNAVLTSTYAMSAAAVWARARITDAVTGEIAWTQPFYWRV